MQLSSKIFVAGHKGLVGSAICRQLRARGYPNVLTRTRYEVNLLEQSEVDRFFRAERPDFVFLCAAKVGGIIAHTETPASFIFENLRIQENVINSSFQTSVTKLLFLGSACAYPRLAPVPIREEYLLSGPLEPTNECYALAKIAGIKMCQAFRHQFGCDFISCMPMNLYGPGDNYNLHTSHVLPGIMHRMHAAKVAGQDSVTLWGTGTPTRDFLYSDDLADACIFLMNNYSGGVALNIGTGPEIHLNELANMIAAVVGFTGKITWDHTKPDGTPRRTLDSSKIRALGWVSKVPLDAGLKLAYKDFLQRHS